MTGCNSFIASMDIPSVIYICYLIDMALEDGDIPFLADSGEELLHALEDVDVAALGDVLHELFVLVVGEVAHHRCIAFYPVYSHVPVVVPFY